MLARIFLQTGRFPDEVMAKPAGVRAFLWAAMQAEGERKG